ncbi:uncharacterized protein CBL_08567 [Carabus blaptoides fortunei]
MQLDGQIFTLSPDHRWYKRNFRTIAVDCSHWVQLYEKRDGQSCVPVWSEPDQCELRSYGRSLRYQFAESVKSIAVVSFGARNCGGSSTLCVYTRVVYNVLDIG